MNKAEQGELISQIYDSISVISGNTQLALKVECARWVDRYLWEIEKQTKTIELLLNKVTDLCQSQCYSETIASGNSSFISLTKLEFTSCVIGLP